MNNIWIVVSVICLFVHACAGGENPGSSSPDPGESTVGMYTQNTVTIQDTATVGKAVFRAAAAPADCPARSDIYSANGTCLSPTQVTGHAISVDLYLDQSAVAGGTRLLGADEFAETPGSVFDGEEFDLSKPSILVTNNTLFEQYDAHDQYDSLGVHTTYYKIQFPMTISSGTQYITMLLAMYGQPFAQSAAMQDAMSNCGVTAQQATESRYQQADLLTGMAFQRGDYLFCVKAGAADACAAADYQWLNTDNYALVSVRPDNPKTAHWLANQAVTCSSEGDGRVNFDFGTFGLFASIDSTDQFKLWSDFSHGELSRQWPVGQYPLGDQSIGPADGEGWVSPYYLYYYQDCPAGACAAEQQGVVLDATLNVDTTGMLFVEGLSTTEIANEANLGFVLSKLQTRTQWAFDQKSLNSVVGFDPVDMAGMGVQVQITLSGSADQPPDGAVTLCADLDAALAQAAGCN